MIHTLFRDPFNRRVMALVVGTFAYCVVVLRSVRSALEDGGEAVVPNFSVGVAVFLGIATILTIVAFINHSAHSMDISEILEDVRRQSEAQIRREWPVADGQPPACPTGDEAQGPGTVVRLRRSGWVQEMDVEALLACLPPGGQMRVETFPGRYAISGTPFATVTPPIDDSDGLARVIDSAIAIGDTRTLQQDVSYGLRQLADVALKALSPGINDPTTAQDAIFHAGAVLAELLRRDPPASLLVGDAGRRLVLDQQHTHAELVQLAFAEVRRAAAGQPTVCVYLLEALELVVETVRATGLTDRIAPLEEQARLVLAGAEAADLLPHDLEVVREAYAKRFGAHAG